MSKESTQRLCVPLRSVRMRAIGDIMFCKGQLAYARNSGGAFYKQFEMIAEQLADADFTMGNLEGTIGQYPTFLLVCRHFHALPVFISIPDRQVFIELRRKSLVLHHIIKACF